MKTLAILGAIAAVALATASSAAPSASQTLRGTVVAKDRAHHALVVASSARVVKAVVTQRTFSRTRVGRTLTIRFTTRHHALPVALSVTPHHEVGELEVRGTVTTLTATALTVAANGSPVTCAIQAAASVTIPVGTLVELKCLLVGTPGMWTLRRVEREDDHQAREDENEVEARGTIAAPFTAMSAAITVTPSSGAPVTCAITPGSLRGLSAGDQVEIECKSVGGVLTLKEIERTDTAGDDHSGPGRGGGDDGGEHHGGDDGGHGGHGGQDD